MKRTLNFAVIGLLLTTAATAIAASGPLAKKNLVIAHRGASGYLPEHTLPAAALAHASGADYIEMDLVLSKDNELVVLHDITLEATTDVEEKFPGRSRKDGKWYAIDFDLAEFRTLNVHERTAEDQGTLQFPSRFPYRKSRFSLPTFEEITELVQGMNKTTGRNIGIYPEIKDPAFHKAEGKNIAKIVIEALQQYGYIERDSGAIIQCFDGPTLRYLRRDLKVKLPLVQLIGSAWGSGKDEWAGMKTEDGLKEVATYADGIGPWITDLFDAKDFTPTSFLNLAVKSKLPIHAYTLRADQLPKGVTYESAAKKIYAAGVSGIFTDHPDKAKR